MRDLNIETDISFICTRVTKITNKEKYKLRQVFQYLKHRINDKRIMGEYSLIQFCTWVNAAYGVHPDLNNHNGGCISFVYRMVHSKSIKQN